MKTMLAILGLIVPLGLAQPATANPETYGVWVRTVNGGVVGVVWQKSHDHNYANCRVDKGKLLQRYPGYGYHVPDMVFRGYTLKNGAWERAR